MSLDGSQNTILNEEKENYKTIYVVSVHLHKIQKLTKFDNI